MKIDKIEFKKAAGGTEIKNHIVCDIWVEKISVEQWNLQWRDLKEAFLKIIKETIGFYGVDNVDHKLYCNVNRICN